MSCRIPVNQRIIVAICIQVKAERVGLAAKVAVLLHEAGELGVVEARVQIVELDAGIEVVAAVAERVLVAAGFLQYHAESVVVVAGDDRAVGFDEPRDVAVSVVEVVDLVAADVARDQADAVNIIRRDALGIKLHDYAVVLIAVVSRERPGGFRRAAAFGVEAVVDDGVAVRGFHHLAFVVVAVQRGREVGRVRVTEQRQEREAGAGLCVGQGFGLAAQHIAVRVVVEMLCDRAVRSLRDSLVQAVLRVDRVCGYGGLAIERYGLGRPVVGVVVSVSGDSARRFRDCQELVQRRVCVSRRAFDVLLRGYVARAVVGVLVRFEYRAALFILQGLEPVVVVVCVVRRDTARQRLGFETAVRVVGVGCDIAAVADFRQPPGFVEHTQD